MSENGHAPLVNLPKVAPREDRERRASGIPWLPNLAAVHGQGFGAQALALLGSKVGLLAALGTVAFGAAAVGVGVRHSDDAARKAAVAKAANARAAQQAGAVQLLPESNRLGDESSSMDGMAYVQGAGDASESAGGASASASAAGGQGAQDGSGAAGGAGAQGADGAKEGAGADPADALAAAMAAAAGGQGAQPSASAGKPQLAKLSGFGGSGSTAGGGGGGAVGQGAGLGGTSGIRKGVDAAVRQAGIGSAGREKLVATGRRTSGIRSSQSMDRLAKMAPNMAANRGGNEASQSAHDTSWDGAKPSGISVSGPGASSPSPGGGGGLGASHAGMAEGGPTNMGGGSGSSVTKVPDIPAYKNITPYQWAIDIAKIIMLLVMVLAILSAVMKKMKVGLSMLPMIYKITAILGGILAILGIYMLAMGQFWQGTIWTVLGGITAIIALKNMDESGKEANKTAEESAKQTAEKGQVQQKLGQEEAAGKIKEGLKGQAPQGGQTPLGQNPNPNAATNTSLNVKTADGAINQAYNGKDVVSSLQRPEGTYQFTRVNMPYTPQNPGFTGHFVSGTYPTTSTVVNYSFIPAPAAAPAAAAVAPAASSFGAFGGGLVTGGLAAGGFATAEAATNADTRGWKEEAKENYEKKYGIDPDTNMVINPAKFDAKYGKGAAERWNREHQNLDK